MLTMNLKNNDTQVSRNGWSFEYGFEQFEKICQIKNLRPRTISNYRDTYKKFLEYIDEHTQIKFINELSQYDIDNYILYLKNKDIRDTSINSYLRGIRAILNFFFENNQCSAIKIRIHKAEKQTKEVYTDNELFKLLEKPCITKCDFITYRNWCIINFFLATGVRVSTLVHIKIEDIDMSFDRIHLTYTKNRKSYIIPMSNQLKTILQEYLQFRKGKEHDYLFCNQYGEMLTTDAVKHAIAKYNKSRNVSRTGLHAFRHTFAKKCVMNGVNVFVLQRLMGHSDLSVTKEYIDLYAEDLAYNIENYNPLDTLNIIPTKKQKNSQSHKKQRITLT